LSADRHPTDVGQSREFLEAIIDSIGDPVFVKDAEHRFTLVNEPMCAMMGTPRDLILGRHDADFFPPEQAAVFLRQDDLVLESGIPDLNEEAFTGADGQVRTISTRKTRHTDGAGRKFIVGVIRDVTEQAQAELVRQRVARRAQAELDLLRHPRTSDAALVAFALEQVISLTQSEHGFIGFVDPTETTLLAHVWSARAGQQLSMDDPVVQFDVHKGGLWADAVTQHQVVIVNDLAARGRLKSDWPAGHVELARSMSVPLLREGRAVLVVALANKRDEYASFDEVTATLFLETLWQLIGHNRAELGLIENRAQLDEVGAMGNVGGWEFEVATRALRWTGETYRIHAVPDRETPDLDRGLLFYDGAGRSTIASEPSNSGSRRGSGWLSFLKSRRQYRPAGWPGVTADDEEAGGARLGQLRLQLLYLIGQVELRAAGFLGIEPDGALDFPEQILDRGLACVGGRNQLQRQSAAPGRFLRPVSAADAFFDLDFLGLTAAEFEPFGDLLREPAARHRNGADKEEPLFTAEADVGL